MRRLYWLAVLLFPLSAVAADDPMPQIRKPMPDEWFACRKDADCTVLKGNCGFTIGVNNTHKDLLATSLPENEAYNAYYGTCSPLNTIEAPRWGMRATCIQGQCKAVRRTTPPGS